MRLTENLKNKKNNLVSKLGFPKANSYLIEHLKIETLNFWFTLTSPFSHITIKQPEKQNSTNIVIDLSCEK